MKEDDDTIDDVEMSVVQASESDAARWATGDRLSSVERQKEVVLLAEQDFPARFAHFVTSTAALLTPAEVQFLKIHLHRHFIVEESMEHLSCMALKHLHLMIRIHFIEESGVDAGGLQREWFMLLNERLVDPELGLFRCVHRADQTFYLNATSRVDNGPDHLIYYYATGRLVGRALLEGTVLNFHLCVPLLKLVLGVPVTFDDLQYYDDEMYRSLVWLLTHDGVDALGLDFTVDERVANDGDGDGETAAAATRVVELVPNGSTIAVTDANKHQYVDRKFKYLLFESVADQLHAFLKGVYEVIPPPLLMLFDYEELDYVLCGTQEIDVDDWEAHTQISSSLRGTKTLQWFWQVVREMPNASRRRLLQFATGCSRVPLVGFKALTSYDGRLCKFTLEGTPYEECMYIRGHACFNRIDLPLYTDRDELQRILYATLDTDIYGFTQT